MSFTRLDWVANFEETRWFLVLRIEKPESDSLNKLLHVCNKVVQEYGQPPLYTEPSKHREELTSDPKSSPNTNTQLRRPRNGQPKWTLSDVSDVSDAYHISIAWVLNSPSVDLLQATELQSKENLDGLRQIRIGVEEIKSKVGNIVTSIPLRKIVLEGRSLFGA